MSSSLINQIKTAPSCVCLPQSAAPPPDPLKKSEKRWVYQARTRTKEGQSPSERVATPPRHLAAFRLDLPSCCFGKHRVSHSSVSICNGTTRKRALIYRLYDLLCGIN